MLLVIQAYPVDAAVTLERRLYFQVHAQLSKIALTFKLDEINFQGFFLLYRATAEIFLPRRH
jgi:hypothetical protein